MKILTKEEEQAHYNATFKGGAIGGLFGTAIGTVGVLAASRRYPSFRALTLPFRVFLGASAGTFAAVIAADRASAQYDIEHNPEKKREYEREREREKLYTSNKSIVERAKLWISINRYPVLAGVWASSMVGSWYLVNRNKYQSGTQKLVQARMWAQGLTLAALLASFAFEGTDAAKGKGRWETIKVLDPNDPEHKHYIEKRIHHERYAGEDQWMEMVAAEEARMNERKARQEKQQQQKQQQEQQQREQQQQQQEKQHENKAAKKQPEST